MYVEFDSELSALAEEVLPVLFFLFRCVVVKHIPFSHVHGFQSEMKLKNLVMKKKKFILDHINANSIVQETQLSQSDIDPTFVPNTEE